MSAHYAASVPPLPGPFLSFERVECFKIVARHGEGREAGPVRLVTAWFTSDGQLVHYEDPVGDFNPQQEAAPVSGDTDKLARIEEWVCNGNFNHASSDDVLALVEIAKAAQRLVDEAGAWEDGYTDALRAALSALDGEAS